MCMVEDGRISLNVGSRKSGCKTRAIEISTWQAPTNGYAQTSAPGRGAANAASTQAGRLESLRDLPQHDVQSLERTPLIPPS